MSIFPPILYYLSISFSLTYWYKKELGKVIPLAFFIGTLGLYGFGLFDQLKLGLYLLGFINVGSLVLVYVHSKGRNPYFFNTTLLVFFLLVGVVVYMNPQRYFYQWDEFSHWGMMVKELVRLDQFYSVNASHLVAHKDYPPMIPLFEYVWLKLSGVYSEPSIYKALQLLGLSLFLPAFSNSRKQSKSFIGLGLMIVLVVVYQGVFDLEDAKFFMTIYLDPILGLLFAYQLYLAWAYKPSSFNNLNWMVSGAFLLLTKEMGFVFYGIASVLLLVKQWKQLNTKGSILRTGFTLGIPLVFLESWSYYFSQFDYVGQFNLSSIRLTQLFSIVFKQGGELWQQEALHNFIQAIQTMPILTRPFPITYYGMSVLFLILALLISLRMPRDQRKHTRIMLGLTILASYGYVLVLMVLYLFSFGPYEGPHLASLLRYSSTYWYALGALFIMVWLSHETKRISKLSLVIILMISLFYTEASFKRIQADTSYDDFETYFTQDTIILRTQTSINDSIYLVAQDQSANILNIFRYLVNDRVFNTSGFDIGVKENEDDVWTEDISPSEFINRVSTYDYIYIYSINDEFYERYFTLFPINFYVRDHQLLKVIKVNDTIQFEVLN